MVLVQRNQTNLKTQNIKIASGSHLRGQTRRPIGNLISSPCEGPPLLTPMTGRFREKAGHPGAGGGEASLTGDVPCRTIGSTLRGKCIYGDDEDGDEDDDDDDDDAAFETEGSWSPDGDSGTSSATPRCMMNALFLDQCLSLPSLCHR